MEEIKYEKGGEDEYASLEWEEKQAEEEMHESSYGGNYDNRLRIDDIL